MPLSIVNATSTSRYSDNSYSSEGSPLAQGWLIVKTAAVLANAKVGNQAVSDTLWTDQYLDPGYYPFAGSQKEGLILVEFKDAVAGTHGIVNGQFVEPGRAAFSAQSQAGSIGAPSGVLTGIIPAAGTTPTAGTGFTYTHTNGTGVYVFTFADAFAAVPVVIACMHDAAGGQSVIVSSVSASGFTATTYDASPAVAGDHPFNFIAEPIV